MARRTTHPVLIALVFALVAGTAACTTTKPGPARPGPTTAAGSLAVWTPCPDLPRRVLGNTVANFTFDCATLKVPRDWKDTANGKTFDLSLARARRVNQTDRIGSLVVNPGGPGGSGVDLAAELAQGLPSAVANRFDIVGFDPRGVGRSTEVRCFSDAQQDTLLGAEPDPVSRADFDAIVALNRSANARCGRKYGATLPLFSTEQAARDMDAVRVAVGDDKINFLGYSYGTLLGAVYAELFPTRVRAMVLDGAVDPTADMVSSSMSQAAGFEHAFDDFTAWCEANTARCPIADDPRGAVTAALAAARVSPSTGSDGRAATAGWVFYAVVSAMYAQEYWESLAQAIAALKQGDPHGVFVLADAYARRSPDGTYTNLFDANAVVNCDDTASAPTVARIREYQTEWRTKYPLFGAPLAIGMLTCSVWPGKRDPYPVGPAIGAPPIIVVGTTGDPATPYAQTAKLANMLGVGEVLTWDGEGHTAYPRTACVTDAVNGYLLNLSVPPKNTVCPAS